LGLGKRLRILRKEKRLTLRALAEATGVDFTYLSKIENAKTGYSPGADTIRALAGVLEVDALELLQLADKVPPELQGLTEDAKARRFFNRAQEIASPDDWDALLDFVATEGLNREPRLVIFRGTLFQSLPAAILLSRRRGLAQRERPAAPGEFRAEAAQDLGSMAGPARPPRH
jgi:transcriptional regulator with XRE-family HTH domain